MVIQLTWQKGIRKSFKSGEKSCVGLSQIPGHLGYKLERRISGFRPRSNPLGLQSY